MTISPLRTGWLVASAGLYGLVAYSISRQQVGPLLGLTALLFWGYWLRIRPLLASAAVPAQPDRFLFGAAVGFRLLLLAALPKLSDDYFRFLWDGRLLANGHNPYLYLPSQLIGTPVAQTIGLDDALYAGLNSPNYYTVYPPLNQALFALAAWLSPDSLVGSVIGLRLPIVLAEIGTLWLLTRLLTRLGRNPNLALLYGLNPLVILELTGNVHYEAVMIFFTLLALWLLLAGRGLLSAGALALAIGTKLLPLLLMPLLLRQLGLWRGLRYAGLTGFFTLALFLPFLSVDLIQNVGASINLYFQKFEFNASIYYVIRAIGYWVRGYNIIEAAGFWLAVGTTLGTVLIAFWRTGSSVATRLLFTLTLYFALATTVHPWYVTTLVAASVFTRFRYPLVWSGTILLSYATYRTTAYTENGWLTALEYALVYGLLAYELVTHKKTDAA